MNGSTLASTLCLFALAISGCRNEEAYTPPPDPLEEISAAILVFEKAESGGETADTEKLAVALRLLMAHPSEIDANGQLLDRLAVISGDAAPGATARVAAGHCLASLARKHPEAAVAGDNAP